MKEWKQTIARADTALREVLARIDASSMQITLVVDTDGRLEGTITDGDIRRAFLKGLDLDAPAASVMNRTPITMTSGDDEMRLLALMRNKRIRQIPIIDMERRVVGLQTFDDLTTAPVRDNIVVLMAGGLGTRLLPLTANKPKPMLQIAGRPILEHALVGLADQGYRTFYFAINYLGDLVEDYFGDGSRWGVSISYLREEQRMGTAGALSLLPVRPTSPFVLMNGDILTKLNFNHLMKAHEKRGANITVCVRNYDYQVPFGVTRIEGDKLMAIDEKPTMRHFVNAGIYVVNPDMLNHIPADCYFDMPQLLSAQIENDSNVHVFPITEYWLDVGRPEELKRAISDFHKGDA